MLSLGGLGKGFVGTDEERERCGRRCEGDGGEGVMTREEAGNASVRQGVRAE